ncbi:MAG: DUF4382 domain-containing protein [Bacteroidota bacterium]
MKKMSMKTLAIFTLIFTGLAFYGCEESTNDINKSADGPGKLKILLTDAPFPTDLVDEANVVINKIDIRNQNHEDDGYPFITLMEEEMSFNLLELTNGVTAELVDIELDSGSYDLVRLYVSEASILLKDGTEHDLFVPSGAQTGIKIFIDPAVMVAGGLTPELILDFNVSKSFIVKGNPNSPAGIKGFIFKPVIKATNKATSGRLTGYITDTSAVALEEAEVSLLVADTVYTSSFTDTLGAYSVIGVDAGTYDVAFTREEFVSDTIMDVEIIEGNTTNLDAQLTPLEEEEENEEGEEGA